MSANISGEACSCQDEGIKASEIAEKLAVLGLKPDACASQGLALYLGMLCRWNRQINLVGPKKAEEIFADLFWDSFHLALFIQKLEHAPSALPPQPRCWDLGAGAGIPGIPLRLLWQKGEYALIEPRQKRALFLENVLARLNLPATRLFAQSAEEFFARKEAQPGADLILSRAFMPWKALLEFVETRLAEKGIVLIMASEPPEDALPQCWQVLESYKYTPGLQYMPNLGKGGNLRQRYFWVLSHERPGGCQALKDTAPK